MIEDWDIVEREVVGDYGLFEIQNKQALSPRTGKVSPFKAIHFPDWTMILPITPDGEVVMVRQFRHGIERVCLELPGGLMDPGDPSGEAAATRELLEETGYAVDAVSPLGRCFSMPALLKNEGLFYLGTGARRVQEPQLDPGEDIEVVLMPLNRVAGMIDRGEIDHGMVLLAFFYYWHRHGR